MAAGDLPARLRALSREGAERARRLGRPVLVSATARCTTEPLAMLRESARLETGLDVAAARRAGAMFWSHTRNDVALAGIGAAVTVRAEGDDRFDLADEQWRTLLADALVDDGGEPSPMAGPLLLGGAAFEPAGPRTPEWAGFAAIDFAVPQLQVARAAGVGTCTLSVLARPHEDVAGEVERALGLWTALANAETPRAASGRAAALPLRGDPAGPDDARWLAAVALAVDTIERGALRKVVLARAVRRALPRRWDALALLDELQAGHPDAYVFGCWRGAGLFVGASPERLVRVAGDAVDASSLAGSAPRAADAPGDLALAEALRRSGKDLAEHALVRIALGEALGGLCDDVRSDDGPSLLTLPHVHHLHTAVHARRRAGTTVLQLVGALHPTPAVGGTPRGAALAFIREHEGLDRGWYAGPVGWVGREAGELAVALRSALLAGQHATLYAGCGIVAGSEPAAELAESQLKLRPMRAALEAVMGAADAA